MPSLFDAPVHNPGDAGDVGVRWKYAFTAFATVPNDTRAHLIANNEISGGITPETFQDQGANDKRIDWLVLHHGNDFVILNLNSSMTNDSEEDFIVAFREVSTGMHQTYPISSDANNQDPYEMTANQNDLNELVAVITGGGTLEVIIFDSEVTAALPFWRSGSLSYGPYDLAMEAEAGQPTASFDLATIEPPPAPNSVTIVIPDGNWLIDASNVTWEVLPADYIDLGTSLSQDGNTPLVLGPITIPRIAAQNMTLRLSPAVGQDANLGGPDFSEHFEASGIIRFVASDGSTLTVTGIGDSTEPYAWTPSNIAAVNAFANNLAGLTDRSLTVTFAVDTYGLSMFGSAGNPTVRVDLFTTPGAPNAPTVVRAATPGVFDVSWGQPSDNGGSPVIDYDLQSRRVGSTAWTRHVTDVTFTSLSVGNFEPGTTYEFQVRTQNAIGHGPWSASGVQSTPDNQRPSVHILTHSATIDSGADLSLNAVVSDDYDDLADLTILWSIEPDLGTFSVLDERNTVWTAPDLDAQLTFRLRINVTDTGGLEDFDDTDVTVRLTPQELAFEASAGNPTATFDLTAIDAPTPEAVSMAARGGNPTAAFNLTLVTLLPQQVAFAARAGDPTASFDLAVIPPPPPGMLRMQARAGSPRVAAFQMRVFFPDTYSIEATTDLLIGQWKEAANLNAVVQILLDVLKEEILDPINRLQLMARIDEAEGVWLDYIGERLGVIRPWTTITTDRFGFEDAGVGFDQARMADAIQALEPRTPIGDMLFRRLLKARQHTMRSDGGIESYILSLREIDAMATVVDNHDMTVEVTTTERASIELGERIGAVALPAGVGRTFA